MAGEGPGAGARGVGMRPEAQGRARGAKLHAARQWLSGELEAAGALFQECQPGRAARRRWQAGARAFGDVRFGLGRAEHAHPCLQDRDRADPMQARQDVERRGPDRGRPQAGAKAGRGEPGQQGHQGEGKAQFQQGDPA